MSCIAEYLFASKNPVATISCGAESVVLIDVVSNIRRDIPFVFIDTGFHFKETLDYFELLSQKYSSLRFISIASGRSGDFSHIFLSDTQKDIDECCRMNKIEVLKRYLHDYKVDVWISGVRRCQTDTRNKKGSMEKTKERITKIYPLLEWSDEDVQSYIKKHSLPTHPLVDKGYYSIGCEPCTKKATDRSGRWCGVKSECGLHV